MSDETGDAEPPDGHGETDLEHQIEKALAEAKRRQELFDSLSSILAGSGKKGAGRTYSVVPALAAMKATAVFDAVGITNEGGNPAVVGKLLIALQRFLHSLGADAVLTGLNFLSSVELEFQPRLSSQEQEQLLRVTEAEMASEEDNAGADLEAPMQVDEPVRVVPTSVVAFEIAAHLLQQPPERIASRVAVLGSEARDELRKLSETLEKNGATLRLVTPAETRAEIDKQRARWYVARLSTPEELPPIEFSIAGKLTATDSEAGLFRVVLDRRRLPHELDGRRKHVEGNYTPQASRQVREGGLWDSDVVAKVKAELERPPGGGKPRPSNFTFVSVKRAAG